MEARSLCGICTDAVPVGELADLRGLPACPTCRARSIRPPAAMTLGTERIDLRRLGGWILGHRIHLALVRIGGYGLVAALMPALPLDTRSPLVAALLGFYAAETFAWVLFRLVDLPRRIAAASAEAIATVIGGGILVHVNGLLPMPLDESMRAVSFLAFVLGLALVIGFWRLAALADEMR